MTPAIEALIDELNIQLDNSYLDPNARIWLTRVVNVLEEECKTNPLPQKSEPGPGQTTFPLDGEDTSLSTSSKGSTKSTRSAPSGTATPSEG